MSPPFHTATFSCRHADTYLHHLVNVVLSTCLSFPLIMLHKIIILLTNTCLAVTAFLIVPPPPPFIFLYFSSPFLFLIFLSFFHFLLGKICNVGWRADALCHCRARHAASRVHAATSTVTCTLLNTTHFTSDTCGGPTWCRTAFSPPSTGPGQ